MADTPHDKPSGDAPTGGFDETATAYGIDLGPDADRLLAEAENDFAAGRTQSLNEFRSDMKGFLAELRNKTER